MPNGYEYGRANKTGTYELTIMLAARPIDRVMQKSPRVCTKSIVSAHPGRRIWLPLVLVAAAMLAVTPALAAKRVPLPRPKPPALLELQSAEPEEAEAAEPQDGREETKAAKEPGPSACQLRLSNIAVIEPMPAIVGPGECGGEDLVRLDAIKLKDKSSIAMLPAGNLRCNMAEAIAIWVREDIAPSVAAEFGAPMRALDNFASYHCRGRNNIIGAKMSEHGRGNALDIRGVMLANKKVEWTDVTVSRKFREKIKSTACGRFMTVLGPGSDGYHENHIHVDLAERRNNHRMCQWDVHDPAAKTPAPEAGSEEAAEEVAAVPLPRPKPADIAHRRRL